MTPGEDDARIGPGLYVVGTPIGNLSDLTRRAEEVLAGADIVYAEDTRRTGILLQELGIDASLRSLHEHNEAARTEEVVEAVRSGNRCVLVSDAGTPAVSDPGRRVVDRVLGEGLRAVPIPGPSAVVAALSVSGLPGDRFSFLGYPPRRGRPRETWMDDACGLRTTIVVFESPRRLHELLAEWERRGLGGRRCVVCRELTKRFEEIHAGTVAELEEHYAHREVRGEVTVVLEGAEPPSWREVREEVTERARELVRAGESTRDVVAVLVDEYGVPRNEAYDLALRVAGEGA